MKRYALAAAMCAVFPLGMPAAHADDHAHWSYEGSTGPAHWAELDESYKTCKLGKHQSPINIETNKVQQAALDPIVFSYKAEPAEIVNTGHYVQVNLPAGSAVKIHGKEYKLQQFHFHTPSEEKIDGKSSDMVVHLVHTDADGKRAVIAVLLKEGKENAALKPLFDSLPSKDGETVPLKAGFDPSSLLPADQAYFTYLGSLTTPPCSEEVSWFVFKTPLEVSGAQIAAFRKLYKADNRPVQPLNGRVVQSSR